MGMDQDREHVESHIQELRDRLAGAATSASPDTQLAAHAALVQSEAALLLADTVRTATQTIVHDGLRPLMMRLPER